MDTLNERGSLQLNLSQTIVQSAIKNIDCGWLLSMSEAA